MPFSDFSEILHHSGASDAFKRDVVAFAEHRPAPRIAVMGHAPRIKVLRVVAQLLASDRTLAVDRVTVAGASGCADFRGVLAAVLEDGRELVFDFVWDCQWRAMQEGWVDGFGLPDQIRAARTFEWRCFAQWVERRPSAVPVEVAAGEH